MIADSTESIQRLVQLQLGVGAQGRAHVVVGHCHQLVQLRLAQLVQLQLDVQAHLDRVGGGGRRRGIVILLILLCCSLGSKGSSCGSGKTTSGAETGGPG